MRQVLSKQVVLAHLQSWNDVGEFEISEEEHSFKSSFSVPGKKLVLTTPFNVGEFYFEFIHDNSEPLVEWVEIMEDCAEDFLNETREIVKLFLMKESRVKKTSGLLGTRRIELRTNEGWRDLFAGET